MSKAPVVSVIVVSYNTRDMTLEAIRSAREQTKALCEFIVVDNASEDGSAEAINKSFPDVKLLTEKVNHGFAKANNMAAEVAKGKFLLLLNPDTVVLDGAIDKLIAFAESRPESKIWGGQTLYADGTLNPTSCWHRITLWGLFCRATGLARLFKHSGLFNQEGFGGWDRSGERDVDIVTGCFFLIERRFWQRLSGFDTRYWMYGEEADLCLRAANLGASPRVTDKACIVHYGAASEKVHADKMVKLLSARALLITRHFSNRKRKLGLFLLQLWPASRSLLMQLAQPGTQSPWVEIWQRRTEWKDGYRTDR